MERQFEWGEEVELNAEDWRGVPIEIGSIIIYSTRHGSTLDIHEARVLEINPREPKSNEKDWMAREDSALGKHMKKFLFNLKVQPIRTDNDVEWGRVTTYSPVTLTKVDRVTVVV